MHVTCHMRRRLHACHLAPAPYDLGRVEGFGVCAFMEEDEEVVVVGGWRLTHLNKRGMPYLGSGFRVWEFRRVGLRAY